MHQAPLSPISSSVKNASIWRSLISLYPAGHRCTTSRFCRLWRPNQPLCPIYCIFKLPLALRQPGGGRRLPASHPERQLDRITRCFKEPESSSQASRTRRDGWSSPAASRRREAARGKVRLPRSVDTELGMAQPGRSLNIAGQRKGCERGWGRERDRSQMSNQLNKTTSCRSTRKTLLLFATTLCRGVFKRRFSI